MSADSVRRSTDADPSTEEVDDLRREVEALRDEVKRLEALAHQDVLTPLLNRRAFLSEVTRAIAYCRRYKSRATLLYLDLDGFKAVNDAHGHAAGDAALIRVAGLLTANIRETDVAGRLGGDEFGVILFHAGEAEARAKAAALTGLIARQGVEGLGGTFGLREWSDHQDAESWLAEADAAMFVRKRR